MSITEILDKGGPVVWILVGYSVLALIIIIERYLNFILTGSSAPRVNDALNGGPRSEELEEKLSSIRGPESAVALAMIKARRQGVEDIGRVASRVGSDELWKMERGLRTLAFLGNTAPLLGLFGTITGMIKAFMVIEQAGGKVDAQALAGGIWEAMVTTGVGLAVSIPTLFFLHFLEGMADRRARSMKRVASLILEKTPGREGLIPDDVIRHREGVLSDGV